MPVVFHLFATMKLLLLLVVVAISSAERTAYIFLQAGQSNSEGYNSDGHTSEDVSYPNILQLSCCKNYAAVPIDECLLIIAQDPLHHQCDEWWLTGITIGFGMSFARAFREDIAEDDLIVIVPAGISGTGFFDNTWTAYTGTGFVKAVDKLKKAYSLLESMQMERK